MLCWGLPDSVALVCCQHSTYEPTLVSVQELPASYSTAPQSRKVRFLGIARRICARVSLHAPAAVVGLPEQASFALAAQQRPPGRNASETRPEHERSCRCHQSVADSGANAAEGSAQRLEEGS